MFASSNATITEGGKNGHYTEARTNDTQTYADLMVNIDKTFAQDYSIVANLGASINYIASDELRYGGPIQDNGLANVFNVFDLDDVKKRATKVDGMTRHSQFRKLGVRLEEIPFLTVTGRNDWASQLAGSNQSSFFYPFRRPFLGTHRPMEYGSGQLPQIQRFGRIRRYAFPSLPHDADLRI